jgi:hypothetical protein
LIGATSEERICVTAHKLIYDSPRRQYSPQHCVKRS